jgi:hypothetical protein
MSRCRLYRLSPRLLPWHARWPRGLTASLARGALLLRRLSVLLGLPLRRGGCGSVRGGRLPLVGLGLPTLRGGLLPVGLRRLGLPRWVALLLVPLVLLRVARCQRRGPEKQQ